MFATLLTLAAQFLAKLYKPPDTGIAVLIHSGLDLRVVFIICERSQLSDLLYIACIQY